MSQRYHNQSRDNLLPRASNANDKTLDRIVERIYRERCNGMQIDIMRIPELFGIARDERGARESHAQVG